MKLRFVSALLGVAQTALPSLARESSYLRRTNIYNEELQNEASALFSDNSRCGNWEIVGDPIHGLSDYEYSGSSVAASADGSTVAIGAPYNSDAFIQQGSVRVHKFRDASNTWEQIGGNIIGSDVKELLGTSVALSGDGKIIAIGSTGHDRNLKNVGRVKVYQYVWYTNTWEKHGSWIFGQKSNEKFGFEVAISSDGSTLAASSSGQGMNTATTVYIFNEANAKWKEIGDSIEERGGGGVSVSLSDNGKVLAIGNRQSNTNAGQVRIFRQSENSSSLTQLGSTLYGNERDNCGASISLTGDGLMIAIGSDGFDNDRGRVEVLKFAEDIQDWKRKGPIILGDVEGSLAGTSVALSTSGGLVVVGAIGKDRFGDESGHTASYIYDSSKSQWHRVGGSVHGEEKDDYAGGKVALSNDGLRLIVAAPFNSMQGIYSGLTRVFDFNSETCSPTISPTKSPIEPTVNPSVTPSATPSATPSTLPSVLPSAASTRPSSSPTEFLAAQPTRIPTPLSSKSPTGAPSTTFEAYSPLWSFLDGWIR
eukprot:scaffold10170_cov277-Chaetoceros_neogracile.AAC.7